MSRPPFYHTGSSSTYASSKYHSVPTTYPAGFKPYPVYQSIDERLLPSRKRSQVIRVLGSTLALALLLIIPILAWSWYAFIQERTVVDRSKLLVYTTAGPTQFLLLSTASITITKLILTPLMALYAYAASADWLTSSANATESRLPSPIHLASLLSIFQGASFFSLSKACQGGLKRRQLAWPPMLRKAVILLVWLLTLMYSLTSVSFWLQLDAKPTSDVPGATNFLSLGYSSQNTLFARTVNQTLCTGLRGFGQFRGPSCGLTDGSETGGQSTLASTTRVMTNTSAESRTVWLDDNIAILVPLAPPTIGYRAKALGVKAVCRSVTDQCAKCNGTQPNTVIKCAGPLAGPTIACVPSAGVNVTVDSMGNYSPSGPISNLNGSKINQDYNANPFAFGDVVHSMAYGNETLKAGGLDYFAGSSGFLYHGRSTGVNVMYCDVAVYDVTYEFTPPETYRSKLWSLADHTTAGYVAYGLGAWFTSAGKGFEVIDGSGQSGLATYPQLYSRQLSKIAVSSPAQIIVPAAAEQLLPGRMVGTQVTLVGMSLLAILLALILITIVAIGTHAAIIVLRTKSKFIATARGRLTSVYPLIGDSFGGLDFDFQNHTSATSAAMDDEAFVQESEADRLQLVQDFVDGGPIKGSTVRLRPRRV